MEKREITIAIEEYKELLEVFTRVKIFADYVRHQDYSIDRETCGRYLGFDLDEKED